MNVKKLSFIFVILLLFGGLLLRLHKLPELTSFDADQEWLAERAKDLTNGDIPLLGPVTSIGSFSIGPGFIYLWSIFSFLTNNDPISGAYLSVVLGVLSCLAVFLFTKYFIDQGSGFVDNKTAYLMLFLTLISSNLIIWDQRPWAPSLFFIAQTLLLTGAYLSKTKQIGYPLMVLGLVLGFQSHFSIVLSFISILIYLFTIQPVKPNKKVVLISLLILFVGLLPNIIFDLSHNFINTKRLIGILGGDGQDYFVSFNKIINTLSYNVSSILYPKRIDYLDNIIIKSIFALVLVNGLRNLRTKTFQNLSFLLLITIIVPSFFFYLNQGKFSEYYLLMTVPSLTFLLALFLKDLVKRKLLVIFILMISISLNYKALIANKVQWNLNAKKEVVQEIIRLGGKENYGISLSIKKGDEFGFRYLFDYYGIKADVPPKQGETKIFTIVIPEGFEGIVGLKDFDGIGLIWQGI